MHVNWLLQGGLDISQHYAGWMFFREDSWMFPIGMFRSLSYPHAMSIVYLDSIPLFAVFFKLFRGILPRTFQYFGMFELLCFILQGILSVKIVKKFFQHSVAVFLSAMLLGFTPFFFWRVYLHIALSAQWILLLAIWTVVYHDEYFINTKRRLFWWGLIGFFCATIHFYFFPMCGIVLIGFFLLDLKNKEGIKKAGAPVIAFFSAALGSMYLLGAFLDGMTISNNDIVWKKSFNLNGFINPQKWSRIVPAMPLHHYAQSEGFAYLGLGLLILGIISMLLLVKRKPQYSAEKNARTAIFLVMVGLSIAAAASPQITLGTKSLPVMKLPSFLIGIWSIFRCCGRMVWVAAYLLMIAFLKTIAACRKKELLFILTLCSVLQGIDVAPIAYDRGSIGKAKEFESELTDDGWQIIGEHEEIKNIVYINVSGLSSSASMAEFANRCHKTLGKYYYAHSFDDIIEKTAKEKLDNPKKQDLFLFSTSDTITMWNHPDLFYYEIDGKILGYCKAIPGLESKQINPAEQPYSFAINELENTVNCEIIDEFCFVHAQGIFSSSKLFLPKGTYRIQIAGENLLETTWEINGTKKDILQTDKHEMQQIGGTVRADGKTVITIKNPSDHDIVLYSISIEKV